jgi:hypothetical protein
VRAADTQRYALALAQRKESSRLECDPYIFMEIAGQHDRSGADLALIREAVDYRQKLVLTDSELKAGLERLSRRRIIRKRGTRYFVSPSIVSSLPRTAAGEVSFRRRDWDKLRNSLFEA